VDAKEIGNRIHDARKSRGKTQAKLAKDLGTTASTISLLESGDRYPQTKTLLRIAEALDVEPASLLAEKQPVEGRLTFYDDTSIVIALQALGLSRHAVAHIMEVVDLWQEKENL